ncbi:MAG: bifunctional adenosylcobinamide kinase/adenosylcobinamide-phosphate guanylyltransferase [Nitrospirae bacterium]|nr:bifunctional adenosylcobinamide kinase/adenosylcobinamide-phosphate guanylyltransferase [Nitrospirota bacterium]
MSKRGEIVFVLGGARSGKSSFALNEAEGIGSKRAYVATARITDNEMAERVRRHQAERAHRWETFEEPLKIKELFGNLKGRFDVIVLDCITLWISNMMLDGLEEEAILEETRGLCSVLAEIASESSVYIVSNEVGLGIVPDNPLARQFRDVAGRVNQLIAQVADRVYFIVSGLSMKLK